MREPTSLSILKEASNVPSPSTPANAYLIKHGQRYIDTPTTDRRGPIFPLTLDGFDLVLVEAMF